MPPRPTSTSPQAAQSRLRYAVETGKIVRPSACAVCDATGVRLVGHHWRGYVGDAALDCWFVCYSCSNRLPAHDGSVTLDGARLAARQAEGQITAPVVRWLRGREPAALRPRDSHRASLDLSLLRVTLAEAASEGASTDELTTLASTWPYCVPGADVAHEVARAEAWAAVCRQKQTRG